MSLLEEAIGFAVEAARGQKDKLGNPDILHPLHVMKLRRRNGLHAKPRT